MLDGTEEGKEIINGLEDKGKWNIAGLKEVVKSIAGLESVKAILDVLLG